MILGILTFIALPSFVACAHKDPEAKSYVGMLVRAQQAHLLQTGKFAGSIAELKSGVPLSTENYIYSIDNQRNKVLVFARTKKKPLKNYVGAAFIEPGDDKTSQGIVCEAIKPGTYSIVSPIDAQTCGEGTQIPVSKKRC